MDPESDISEYEICLGTSQGECDETDFHSVGLDTTHNFTDLKLRHQETYYVTVRATNNAGLSTQVTSDEIKIDVTPPQPVKKMSGISLDLEEICSAVSGGSCNTTTSGKTKLVQLYLYWIALSVLNCPPCRCRRDHLVVVMVFDHKSKWKHSFHM
jgi:hypothetical protein